MAADSSSTGSTPRALVPLAPHPSVVPIDSSSSSGGDSIAKPVAEPTELLVPDRLQPLAAIVAAAQRSSPMALHPRPEISPAQLLAVAAALVPMPQTAKPTGTPKPPQKEKSSLKTDDQEQQKTASLLVKLAPAGPTNGLSATASSSSSGSSSSSSGDDSDSAPASPSASTTSSTSATRAKENALSQPDSSMSARTRMMKKCTVAMCGSYARSRGLCKAHGGGKRCLYTGCELSDQGGGFCIRHGGGKRCLVEGCTKSAQSRHYCKAHGGGARCLAPDCEKSSQGGGFCRGHGGGPQRKKMVNAKGELVESPRSRKRSSFRANMAARALVCAAEAIENQEQEEHEKQEKMKNGGNATEAPSLEVTIRPPTTENSESSPKSLKRASPTPTPTLASGQDGQEESGEASTKKAKVGGGEKEKETGAQEEHDTQLFVAASLLGMQTAPAE